jgi:glycosyltransferase involved in cell wall biosynthesis
VLYVSDAASIHTRRWAEHFRDQGVDVHVASFRDAAIEGVSVHRLPTWGLERAGYLMAVPLLRRLYRRLLPDVVHAQYVTSYGFLAAVAGLRPLVVTAWGTDVLISPHESRLLRWLARRALRGADRVTTVAEHMNASVAALGVPLDQVVAMPFGVDTQLFRPPPAPLDPGPPLRVISTRNFGPIYSVHTVVDAIQAVRAGGLDVVLDLVGDGPLRAELEARVDAAGLKPYVTFHGHVDPSRLAALLANAHVFVSSALSDGNNVSLNEAMACGCYPIATRIPANAQWIDPGDNGDLFVGGDEPELARLIARAGRDAGLRLRAAAKNRSIVEARADWRVCTRKMRNLYESLIPVRR